MLLSQLIEVFYFFKGTEAGGPTAGCDFLPFRGQGGSENIRAARDSSVKKPAGFPGIGNTKKREVLFIKNPGDFKQSMAVGAALDDRHDVLTRVFTGEMKVVSKGGKFNFGPSSWRGLGHEGDNN